MIYINVVELLSLMLHTKSQDHRPSQNLVLEKKIFKGFCYFCCKIGQGHPRVMIYINYDGPASPMQYTKFRGNLPNSSGEDC